MNMPTHMLPYDLQLSNEYRFSRKHIDKYIRKEILESPELSAKVTQGVSLLVDWASQSYYESKNQRLQQLQPLDFRELVLDVFTGIAYVQQPEMFTTVSGQLAARLGFDDKRDAIITVAEIVTVLCDTDAFDLIKLGKYASLMIQSRMPLSEQLITYIVESVYLPPMVCLPETLTNNRQSAYLTHNESVILKSYNHHDDDICLDVLNIQNAVALSLDEQFIRTFEEPEPDDLREIEDAHLYTELQIAQLVREKEAAWDFFKIQSLKIAALMVGQGNRFWLTHRVDKRGRIYASGYHITTQGSKYKKAAVELADREPVTGVPT